MAAFGQQARQVGKVQPAFPGLDHIAGSQAIDRYQQDRHGLRGHRSSGRQQKCDTTADALRYAPPSNCLHDALTLCLERTSRLSRTDASNKRV
jgi:hypothetical protein